jgi:hypothetical protein
MITFSINQKDEKPRQICSAGAVFCCIRGQKSKCPVFEKCKTGASESRSFNYCTIKSGNVLSVI